MCYDMITQMNWAASIPPEIWTISLEIDWKMARDISIHVQCTMDAY